MPAARSLANVVGPAFEGLFELGHELACVGAVDGAVIESQAEVLGPTNRNRIVAFAVGEDDGLLFEAADGEDRAVWLIDDGRAELFAEDAGVGKREG